MGAEKPNLVIVIRPGLRTRSIQSWLRQLFPAALLVVAAAALPSPAAPDLIVLDEEEIASGPLSLASAIMRSRGASAGSSTAPRVTAGEGLSAATPR